MPEEGISRFHPSEILSYEEIARIARVAAGLGVERVRLTGGEPLVRKDLDHLVRLLAGTAHIRDLALTTNGHLLALRAQALKDAGLRRVNVSLDTLDPTRYALITRGARLEAAVGGLEAALEAGLHPVKVNVVLVGDPGEEAGRLSAATRQDIAGFARLSVECAVHVRFIELMPVGIASGGYVRSADVLAHLATLGDLQPDAGPTGSGPARYFRLRTASGEARGTLGVISGTSEVYCEGCNRLRLTATGRLRTCLFGEDGFDLKPWVRGGASDTQLGAALRQAACAKPISRLEAHRARRDASMCQIGG